MNKTKNPTKILIVDDYELSRNGLLFGFKSESDHFEIIGEAENGEEAIFQAREKKPDIILMDIAMPVMDGIEATRILKEKLPSVKIVILTSRQESEEIFASLSAGADAYCMKDVSTEHLINIINMIMEGGFWLDPGIARLVLDTLRANFSQLSRAPSDKQSYRVELTAREREVLELMAKGKNNKAIAETLVVSINTVKVHVSNIMQKLSVDDRTEAALKALKEGLIRQE